MCYAIPGKVKGFQDKIVLVDYFGEEKKAVNELDSLELGDYIYAQGGYVIEKIPRKTAEDILRVWKETFFELQELDLKLSRVERNRDIDRKVVSILDKVLGGVKLSKEDLLYLINCGREEDKELIFKTANFLRQKYIKNSCCVHGIIEISNICSVKCRYCGISVYNSRLNRYRMSGQEIIDVAVEAVNKFGFKALVLQSGESDAYTVDELSGIISEIKKRVPVLICASFGETGIGGLEKLFKAGVRALLLRFETSNPELYEKIHPLRKLESRIEHLKEAYKMGFLIMTGALIGIPGQTKEDIVNDILLSRELKAEMYSFGPFIPHPDTPLGSYPSPSEDLVLKTLSLIRLTDPEQAKILVTTAFETLSPSAREKGLLAGANSVMLNVTPEKYREDYAIYPGKAYNKVDIREQIDETLSLLRSLGRAPTDLGVQ